MKDDHDLKCFCEFAERSVEAQFGLGWCYENGKGVDQSYEEAVKWYRKAAEQGFRYAQFSLGWCYENGKGVDQSYEEAVKWYSRATEQWETDMKYSLGVCYFIW